MLKICSARLFLIVLALSICSATVFAASPCPLVVTGNGSLVNNQLNPQLVYVPGFSGGLTVTVPMTDISGFHAFSIDTTASPTWLHVTGESSTAPTNLIITADPDAMLSAGVTSTQHPQFVLRVAGDNDCPVTVDVLYQSSPVTMDSSSYLMRFTGTAVTKTATITVTDPVSAAFTLDPSLPLPSWLTATVTGPATSVSSGTILFDTTAGVNTLKGMAPGNIIVPLRLLVNGCSACSVNFSVMLSIGTVSTTALMVNGTSTGASSGGLVAASPTPVPIAWSAGNSTAAAVFVSAAPNAVSFTASCSYTKTNSNYAGSGCYFTQGTSQSHYTTITSLASTFPSAFNVNFDANLLDSTSHGAVYGDSVTVSVLVTPAVGSAVTLKYQFSLTYPTASLVSVSPTSIASPPTGSLVTAVLSGTGFVPTSAQTGGHATRVFIGTPLALEPAGMVVNVVNATTIVVSIPAALLQSGKVLLGTMNQATATPPAAPASSTVGITVTTNPVISAVTNAASYALPPDPTLVATVSPFEVISIFGSNFIPASGTGALPQGTSILVGAPDTIKYVFPQALSNIITTRSGTTTTTTTYSLKVGFQAQGTNTTVYAYLLFATPNQINAMVPSSVIAGTKYNVTVGYGLSTGNLTYSDAFVVKAAAAHPGVFTADAAGLGQGAVINNTATPTMNSALIQADAGTIVSIYMTGLGSPNSTATNNTGSAGYPGSCLSPAAYVTAAGLGSTATIDGAVILSSKLSAGKFAPCLQNTVPSNTIVTVNFACKSGGGSIPVDTTSAVAGTYAGFVADAVAGLYQVNVAVPAGLSPGDCPITVTVGSGPIVPVSQPGVTLAVSGH